MEAKVGFSVVCSGVIWGFGGAKARPNPSTPSMVRVLGIGMRGSSVALNLSTGRGKLREGREGRASGEGRE